MHSPHDIVLKAGIVYLSFITTVEDIDCSDRRATVYGVDAFTA